MGDPVKHAWWNRQLGWALLIAGFATGAWLDPWSLAERDPDLIVGSARMAARHAQAVVVGMAFLQLMLAKILSRESFPPLAARLTSSVAGLGALVYAGGYASFVNWAGGAWLIVAGAWLNFLALAVLLAASGRAETRPVVRAVLLVFCLGMSIDAVMGMFAASPGAFLPAYVGPEDGVRLRMLRLARAAVIALSLLVLLYEDLMPQGGPGGRFAGWGRAALLVGAVGMPLVLAAAAFSAVGLKLLLPIPAQATFWGTLAGLWLAWSTGRPLEAWGWLLIGVSMAAGLLMGLYAFEGPFAAPAFLGAYNDFSRRLSRLAHAYCIVLGLLSIFLARELNARQNIGWPQRLGRWLLIGGTIAIIAGIALVGIDAPPAVLSIGPAVVALAIVLCLFQEGEKAKPAVL